MELDELCREALERLAALTQRRIDAFQRYVLRDAERTRRSFGQKWRHVRKELIGGR